MPITKGAKKALRQSLRKRERNLALKRTLKNTVKKFKASPSPENLSMLYKKVDKAAKVNLIKKNTASRMKSRLSKKLAQTS